MRRILLDEDAPEDLKAHLTEHSVIAVSDMQWKGLKNGLLLRAAEEAGFEIIITGDKNMSSQNTISKFNLALLVLNEKHWSMVFPNLHLVREAIAQAQPGKVLHIPIPFRPRRPRSPPTQSHNESEPT